MRNTATLAPIGSSEIELPFYSASVPAGFPSPAQDQMEQSISLDELLDIDAPHTYLVQRGEFTDDLFAEIQPEAAERVMTVLDQINHEWGHGTMRPASVPVAPGLEYASGIKKS